jgi:hypothetical protein
MPRKSRVSSEVSKHRARQIKVSRNLRSVALGAAVAVSPLMAGSADHHLSLKHGVYVRAEAPCRGAPNAAILSWNGAGFSGAHSSQCKSQVAHQEGTRFAINTTCAAQGDGLPNKAGSDNTDSFVLNRLSRSRFEFIKDGQDKATYRWCSVKTVD